MLGKYQKLTLIPPEGKSRSGYRIKRIQEHGNVFLPQKTRAGGNDPDWDSVCELGFARKRCALHGWSNLFGLIAFQWRRVVVQIPRCIKFIIHLADCTPSQQSMIELLQKHIDPEASVISRQLHFSCCP